MINLLPRKEFEIKLSDKVVSGKFGTWAMKRFCDKRKWTLNEFSDHFSPVKKEDGTIESKVTIDDIADFILCAIEYSTRLKGGQFNYTEVNVYDWIDQIGGFESNNLLDIINHASGEGGEEKKSNLNGENSKEFSTQPA